MDYYVVLTASLLGMVFLAAMTMYWLRPIRESIFQHRPPGIIHIAYSLLTVFGVVSGMIILIRSARLPQSLSDMIKTAISEAALGKRTLYVQVAMICMLCFIIGNLLRSYYNLHAVEHHYPRPLLTQLIRSMTGHRRWLEWTLRLLMFVTILLINKFTVALQLDGRQPVFGIGSLSFGTAFRLLWIAAAAYYAVLLAWDYIIALQNKGWANGKGRTAIGDILRDEALPVHRTGLVVAVAMVVAFSFPDNFDLFAIGAGLLALLGITRLTRSWYRNIIQGR